MMSVPISALTMILVATSLAVLSECTFNFIHIGTKKQLQKELAKAGDKLAVIAFMDREEGLCSSMDRVKALELIAWVTREDLVLLRVDVDETKGVAKAYKVAETPTFILQRRSKRVDRLDGANQFQLVETIEHQLPQYSDLWTKSIRAPLLGARAVVAVKEIGGLYELKRELRLAGDKLVLLAFWHLEEKAAVKGLVTAELEQIAAKFEDQLVVLKVDTYEELVAHYVGAAELMAGPDASAKERARTFVLLRNGKPVEWLLGSVKIDKRFVEQLSGELHRLIEGQLLSKGIGQTL